MSLAGTTMRVALVFSIFFLAARVQFQPWLAHFSTALIGPPENNLQDFWNVWYAAHTSLGQFFHTDLLRFPDGTALNFHSFSYPHVMTVAALTHWLGSDRQTLIWLNNAALFATFPLAGVSAFFLVRKFVKNDLAALAGAFIFAFSPWHVGQLMHHAHVTHIEFVPLFVLAYLNALEKKSTPWLVAGVVSGALAALSGWYYLFYAIYFMIFHAAYARWHDKKLLSGWLIRAPLITLAGMAVLISPLIVPMLLKSSGVEHPGGSDAFVADIEAFFAFPPSHVFADWSASFWARAHKWTSNNTFEGAAYLGLVNIVLMAWLYHRHRRCNDPLAAYLFWGLGVFCLIAMGDCIHAFGFDTLIPIPGILLSHIPLFSQVRTPGRIMVMAYLFLGIGVAHALRLLAEEWRIKPWAKGALAGIAALIVIDFYPAHIDYIDARCPKGLEVIANDPERGFGVLNLPLYDQGDIAMFQQTCHGKPVVQAAISRSFRPPLSDRLDEQNLAVQRTELLQAHVKYLVLDQRGPWATEEHPAKYAFRAWVVRTFPSLAKVKWIAPPKYRAPIAKADYFKTFPAVFRSNDFIILKVE